MPSPSFLFLIITLPVAERFRLDLFPLSVELPFEDGASGTCTGSHHRLARAPRWVDKHGVIELAGERGRARHALSLSKLAQVARPTRPSKGAGDVCCRSVIN